MGSLKLRGFELHQSGLTWERVPLGGQQGPEVDGRQRRRRDSRIAGDMLLDSLDQATQLQPPCTELAAAMTSEKRSREAAPPAGNTFGAIPAPMVPFGSETQLDLPTISAAVVDDSPAAPAAVPAEMAEEASAAPGDLHPDEQPSCQSSEFDPAATPGGRRTLEGANNAECIQTMPAAPPSRTRTAPPAQLAAPVQPAAAVPQQMQHTPAPLPGPSHAAAVPAVGTGAMAAHAVPSKEQELVHVGGAAALPPDAAETPLLQAAIGMPAVPVLAGALVDETLAVEAPPTAWELTPVTQLQQPEAAAAVEESAPCTGVARSILERPAAAPGLPVQRLEETPADRVPSTVCDPGLSPPPIMVEMPLLQPVRSLQEVLLGSSPAAAPAPTEALQFAAPMDFDVQIEAPVGAVVAAPAAANGEFDYFTATQQPTQENDGRHAWAAGLPPPPLPPRWQVPVYGAPPRQHNTPAAAPSPAHIPPPPPRPQQQPDQQQQQQPSLLNSSDARRDGHSSHKFQSPGEQEAREYCPPPVAGAALHFPPSPLPTEEGQQGIQQERTVAAVAVAASPGSGSKRARSDGRGESDGAPGGGQIAKQQRAGPEDSGRAAPAKEADAAPPPAGMVPMLGFSTGRGGSVHVSAARLDAAKRLLEVSPPPGDDPTPMEENDAGDLAEGKAAAAMKRAAAERSRPTTDSVLMAGFSTGRGGAVHVSAAKLAAAAQAFAAVDEDASEGEGRDGNGAAADTPTLRRQVLNSRSSSVSPAPGAAAKVAGGIGAVGLSRFAPQPPQAAAAAAVTPAAAPGFAGGTAAGRARRGGREHGRGNFVTPRSIARPRPAPPLPGSAACSARLQPAAAPPTTPMLQLHTLQSSALRSAMAAVQEGGGQQGHDCGLQGQQPLPLDSQMAAEYLFLGTGRERVGWERMRLRLMDAGARGNLATDDWVRNHYRWVVWKLARLELATGPAALGRLLTADIAEDELRRRYEREHVRGHRPLLKSLLQQDEPSGTAAVLLIASVDSATAAAAADRRCACPGGGRSGAAAAVPLAQLELTDGWYYVRAQCDEALSVLLRSGRVGAGSKLRICSAELTSAGPGDPLVAGRSAVLRLTANNTRPAPPGVKLGRQPHRSTLLPLRSINPAGGTVPQTLVVVYRCYPPLVWCKLSSGVTLMQTQRVHAAAQRRVLEDVAAAEAAAAHEAQEAEAALCRMWLRHSKHGGLTEQERWYAAMVTGQDSAGGGGGAEDFLASLSAGDRASLQRYVDTRQAELQEGRREALERHLKEVPALPESTAEVATLLVGEVTHCRRGQAAVQGRPAMALVTMWRPGERAAEVREGQVYRVGPLDPGKGAGSGAGSLHDGVLHLRTTRNTRWEHLAAPAPALAHQPWPRTALSLAELPTTAAGVGLRQSSGSAAVFDFTGVVLGAGPRYQAHDYSFYSYQWVFLADETCTVPTPAAAVGVPAVAETAKGGQQAAEAVGNGAECEAALPSAGCPLGPWLLAVKLQGELEAVDWIDGSGDAGEVFCLRDLELSGSDEERRLWRADGGKHCSVARGRGGRGGGGAAAAAWAAANPDALAQLTGRVAALLAV